MNTPNPIIQNLKCSQKVMQVCQNLKTSEISNTLQKGYLTCSSFPTLLYLTTLFSSKQHHLLELILPHAHFPKQKDSLMKATVSNSPQYSGIRGAFRRFRENVLCKHEKTRQRFLKTCLHQNILIF